MSQFAHPQCSAPVREEKPVEAPAIPEAQVMREFGDNGFKPVTEISQEETKDEGK